MDITKRNEVVESNYGLVLKVVNDLFGSVSETRTSLEREDLIQSGSIGLIKAATGYDESKGAKFSTYAYQAIKNEILKAIAKYDRDVRLEESNSLFSLDSSCETEDGETPISEAVEDEASSKRLEEKVLEMSSDEIIDMIVKKEKSITRVDGEFIKLQKEGYTSADIAKMKGIERNFVNKRVALFRRKVKNSYMEFFEGLDPSFVK